MKSIIDPNNPPKSYCDRLEARVRRETAKIYLRRIKALEKSKDWWRTEALALRGQSDGEKK